MKRFFFVWTGILVILTCLLVFGVKYSKGNSWMVQNLSPAPPVNAVRLIFIHHSVGENWLCDDNGGLGIALRDNHYYVSDTIYGWGPTILAIVPILETGGNGFEGQVVLLM